MEPNADIHTDKYSQWYDYARDRKGIIVRGVPEGYVYGEFMRVGRRAWI